MPSESTSSAHPASLADPPPLASSVLKCTLCGIGQAADGEQVPRQGSNGSLCEGCLRTIAQAAVETDGITPERGALSALVEADSDDVESETSQRWSRSQTELETEPETVRPPAPIPYASAVAQPPTTIGPQSLPVPSPRPWPLPTSGPSPSPPRSLASERQPAEKPANPLLDVTERRVPSVGRGCLYPGSVFRGTQTSGRSAYDVEVRLLDVSFPESTLSGYLSISHLTDTHPHLTTFFSGEIIGPRYGFLTGPRYQATEHDDMRHWGRFEQFRRPATRADMIRPDLTLRDPLADAETGRPGKERTYAFMRWKEQFLVPDHKVRDISGASFAGFYYIVVDFCPSDPSTSPGPPIAHPRRRSSSATSPDVSSNPRSPSRDTHARPRIRERTSSKIQSLEPVLRGYYFHHLNQEPFQELSLTHVPARSSSTYEIR